MYIIVSSEFCLCFQNCLFSVSLCFVLQSSSVCHMCLSIHSSRCNPPQGNSLHISLSLSLIFYVSFQWRYIVVVPSPMRQLAVFIQLTCHSRFLVDSFSVEPSHKYYVHVVFSQSILTLLVVGLIQFPGESSSDPRFCTRFFFAAWCSVLKTVEGSVKF
jgi:hypothetical protein